MHGPQQHKTDGHADAVCTLLLPTGRDADLVAERCRRHGIETLICRSAEELLGAAKAGHGPLVLADDSFNAAAWRALTDLLQAEPEWSELPVVILSRHGAFPACAKALKARRSTTVLQRPTDRDVLIGVLQADIDSRRRQLQVRNLLAAQHDLNRQLESRARQLQRLTMALTQAEEKERQRVANTLHDGLQQLLAAARVTLARLQPQNREDHDIAVKELDAILADAIDASRTLAYDLSPPLLHHAGLGPALEQLADTMKSNHELTVTVNYRREAPKLGEHVRVFLFEAARELLFNVSKHAGVSRAHVEIAVHGHSVRLSVRDGGAGFDPAVLQESNHETDAGFGLFRIRERTHLLGGKFEIETKQGHGACLSVLLPRDLGDEQTLDDGTTPAEDIRETHDTRPPAPVTVLVADDHSVMRNGLVAMLAGIPDIEVIGEAGDGIEALKQARKRQPDVVVMDVSMPGMNGVDVTRKLREELPDIRVVGLSMFEEADVADEMLAAGASAYLVKSGPAEGLVNSILACRNVQADESQRD